MSSQSSGFPLFACDLFGPCAVIISTSDPKEFASVLAVIDDSKHPVMLLTNLETNREGREAVRHLRPEVGDANFAFFIRNGVGVGPSKVEAICEGYLIHQRNEGRRLQQYLRLLKQPDEEIVEADNDEPINPSKTTVCVWGKCFAKCFSNVTGPVRPWTSHFIRYNGKTWSFHFNSTLEEVQVHLEAARGQKEE